jgi:hypothetical protein
MDDHWPHDDRWSRSQRNGINYNYDFGDDNEVTWVDQSAYSEISSGYATTGWWHHDGGESSSLIFGVFIDYGHNSCAM